jgi:hypothetical protein
MPKELETKEVKDECDVEFQPPSTSADVLNDTISHIGMRAYQWKLFVLCGLGTTN